RRADPRANAATPPAKGSNSAHFQKKFAIFLAELRALPPVVNLQPWYDCVLWQGRRIEQPRVGNHFLQLAEILLAQFASPKLAQRLHPKKCEPHFLLQVRLDRRSNGDLAFGIGSQRILDSRNVWQIE